MTEKRIKCTDERYCSTLSARITLGSFSTGAGLGEGAMMSMKTGRMRPVPVWYQPTKGAVPKEESRLLLNFCPFCGVSFRRKIKKFEQALRASDKVEAAALKARAKEAARRSPAVKKAQKKMRDAASTPRQES